MARATLSHQLHDLGLAAWFGGTLANAVALNPAAAASGDPSRVGAVANAGWDRWTPVNAAAIGVHLAGAVGLLKHEQWDHQHRGQAGEGNESDQRSQRQHEQQQEHCVQHAGDG